MPPSCVRQSQISAILRQEIPGVRHLASENSQMPAILRQKISDSASLRQKIPCAAILRQKIRDTAILRHPKKHAHGKIPPFNLGLNQPNGGYFTVELI